MAEKITTPDAGELGRPTGTTATTNLLLACGAVAGPLFLLVALGQVLTRAGFDAQRHPASLLSLGDLGWIQIANFVVTGLLFVAYALGMRRAMNPGRGATWGSRLIGIFGVSLIAGGVFVADPALGFPPGTPEGTAVSLSWHGILHAIAPVVGFNSLIVACFVLARRFAALNQPGWEAYSAITGAMLLPLSVWPSLSRDFIPLWVALALGLAWTSAVAARLMSDLDA